MTGQQRDYDEVLRRVLHSTTDLIEPVGDGLTKIQARLAEPWLKRQWWLLRTELIVLGWVLAVRCQSWLNSARSRFASGEGARDAASGEAGTAAGAARHGGRRRSPRPVLGGIVWAKRLHESVGPAMARLRTALGVIVARVSGKRPPKSVGPAMAWLRPALAVAGAVVLVVAGVFALGQIRATFVGLENDNPIGTSNSSHGGGPGTENGHSVGPIRGDQSSDQGSAASASPSASRRTHPSPAACVTPTPPPINSPTPSPTSPSPTPDPTPTTSSPSPTPSPSPTASYGQMASSLPGGQTQTTGTVVLLVCEPTVPVPSPTGS